MKATCRISRVTRDTTRISVELEPFQGQEPLTGTPGIYATVEFSADAPIREHPKPGETVIVEIEGLRIGPDA